MPFNVTVLQSKIIKDVIVFQPSVSYDQRGSIFTSYDRKDYDQHIPNLLNFNHDKFAESKKNVLRGLHGDTKTWKLVSCISGSIFQVVVDIRPDSETYLQWESWELSDKNKLQILIPPNFVNGYYVLSNKAAFHYKLAYEGDYFDVNDQIVIKWNDPRLNIAWPCKNPILQSRDK